MHSVPDHFLIIQTILQNSERAAVKPLAWAGIQRIVLNYSFWRVEINLRLRRCCQLDEGRKAPMGGRERTLLSSLCPTCVTNSDATAIFDLVCVGLPVKCPFSGLMVVVACDDAQFLINISENQPPIPFRSNNWSNPSTTWPVR